MEIVYEPKFWFAELLSGWVVSHALRQAWPDFLRGSPQGAIIKGFLVAKISPAYCGFLDAFALEKAA